MATIEDDVMEGMMEAVTMYSCKLCSYMTKTSPDLRKHIQQVHSQKFTAKSTVSGNQSCASSAEGSGLASAPAGSHTIALPSVEPYLYPVYAPVTSVYRTEMDSAVSSIPVENSEQVISQDNGNIVQESGMSVGIPVTIATSQTTVIQLSNQFNATPPGYTSLLGTSQLQKAVPLSAYTQNQINSEAQKVVPVQVEVEQTGHASGAVFTENQSSSEVFEETTVSAYSVEQANAPQMQKVVPFQGYPQSQSASDIQKGAPTVEDIIKPETSEVIAVSCDEQILDENIHVLADAKEQFRNIQFVNQDEQGQIILQDSENVEFGEGATIQVLVHDTDVDGSAGSGFEKEVIPLDGERYHTEEKAAETEVTEALTGEPRERTMEANGIHYIIENDGSVPQMEVGVGTSDRTVEMNVKASVDEQTEYMAVSTVTEGENKMPAQTSDQMVESKEMFMCGSCRRGFTDMAMCEAHIMRDHNVVTQTTTSEGKGDRIDVGTQMEPRKRVGRKRKSEVEAERLATEKKESKEEETVMMSDSDEDWTENFEMCSYSTRSKRRRRPPSSLRNDYYLGKSRLKVVKKHAETGHNIRCEIKGCSARFREEETMRKHLDCHINIGNNKLLQFKCSSCDETFAHWTQTRYHLWKSHRIDYDLFTCDICNTYKADTMSKLKIHKEIHGSERRYSCPVCGKSYKQFAQLKNHEVLHTEYSSADYQSPDLAGKWHTPKTCDICSRVFANAKCLKKHKEDVHSGNKPYACRYCSHKCSRKAMMILHERTHTGDKPFKCDQCQYTCGDHNSLRRHKMRHSGQKPYKCEHCGYACIQSVSLKVHMKKKHPGLSSSVVFSCTFCKYRTVNKQKFDSHLLDHKNGLIETVEVSMDQDKAKARDMKNVKAGPVRTNKLLYDIMALIQSTGQNVMSPQIIQIPVPTANGAEPYTTLEVEMNESGTQVISTDDLAKLYNCDGLVQTDAQLLYSALSAISQNTPQQQTVEPSPQPVADIENPDIHPSIETITKGDVTTITVHLPEGEELGGEVILHEEQPHAVEVCSEESGIAWQQPVAGVVQETIE